MTGILNLLMGTVRSAVATDPYFEYTTLLLPGSGTSGTQNNSFVDSSANAFSITRNPLTGPNAPTQGTFSPFSQTGWGNYFDGSTDSLSVASNAAFAYGTSDFTWEVWVFPTASTWTSGSGNFYIIEHGSNGGTLFYYQNRIAYYNATTGTGSALYTSGGTVAPNEWSHIAVSRESGTTRIYVNGQLNTSGSDSNNYAAQAVTIGRSGGSAQEYVGYMSNVRIVKGTAVYTSAFTPPTAPLTAISGTSLLTCQSNRFIDNSTNNFTITVNGNTSVVAFSPFNPTASWSAATYGGSGYFDGSGDYLSIADNDAFALGSNDWTIECWVYVSSLSSQGFVAQVASNGADASIGFVLGINASGYPYVASYINGAYTAATASTAIVVNQWNHIAGSRASGTMGVFLNGSRLASTAVSGSSVNSTATVTVGASNSGSSALTTGYIANARIVNGTAVYSGTTYTVPTAPLTAITNTSLLLNFTNAGVYDATSKNDLETVGDAQISNTTAKWGSTSIKFDGTGDYLQSPDSELVEFGSGDFTIETWVRFAALPSSGTWYALVSKWDNSTQKSYFFYVYNFSGTYQLYFTYTTNGSTNINPVATITPSINTWYHYAVSRSGANLRMFIDGTQVGSTYNIATDTIFGGTYPLQVGASTGANTLNGYMQDVRVTKGYARYTANFTAPTAAFPTL